jgi:hypothetical protein
LAKKYPCWLSLKELMQTREVRSFEITEMDVVRWARDQNICVNSHKGRKRYDLNEVIGYALALSSGWLIESDEAEEEY